MNFRYSYIVSAFLCIVGIVGVVGVFGVLGVVGVVAVSLLSLGVTLGLHLGKYPNPCLVLIKKPRVFQCFSKKERGRKFTDFRPRDPPRGLPLIFFVSINFENQLMDEPGFPLIFPGSVHYFFLIFH